MAHATKQPFKPGDRVEVIDNEAGHGWPIGTRLIVASLGGSNPTKGGNWRMNQEDGTAGSWTIYGTDMRLLARSKKEVEDALVEAKAKVQSLEARIAYMDEIKSEEYDEDEFLAYEALRIVETEGSILDRAKALARLIKNGRI